MSKIRFGEVRIVSEWTSSDNKETHWVRLESPTFRSHKKAEEWLDKVRVKLRRRND